MGSRRRSPTRRPGLNLHSEASLRFKRGTDPEIAPVAARRFAELLAATGAGTLHPGAIDASGNLPGREPVRVRTRRVNAILGTSLGRGEVARLIEPIGFDSAIAPDDPTGDDLIVQLPTFRPDCVEEIDVIEEVARRFGYAELTKTVPVSPHTGGLSARQESRRTLRRALIGIGLSEAMPMPFLAPGDLERCGLDPSGLVLANPLAAEESVLRTSLRPGLLAAVAHNARHRVPGVKLFEIGHVFGIGGEGVIVDVEASSLAGRVLSGERESLGVVLAGEAAPRAVEIVELLTRRLGLRSLVLRAEELPGLHPGRGALVDVAGVEVGQVGEIDPGVVADFDIDERVAWLELDLSVLLDLPHAGAPGQARQPLPVDRHRSGVRGGRGDPGRRRAHDRSGRGGGPGPIGGPVRRVPIRRPRRGSSQSGVPGPFPGDRPHAHRRRGGPGPLGRHRRGRPDPRSHASGVTPAPFCVRRHLDAKSCRVMHEVALA